MSDVVEIKTGFLIKLGNGFVFFIVWLSAFFVIKLAFMVPLNLLMPEKFSLLIGSIGTLFFLLSIYLAYGYTEKLNASGTRRGRNIQRALTIVTGLFCMVISTTLIALSKG
jgi:hypothetical protein